MAQALAYEKAVLEVRAMAQKQLEIDLSVVTPLVDSNWADFLQQIKTCVYRDEWEPAVLHYKDEQGTDIVIPPLVPAAHNANNFRLHAQIKNC